MPVNCSDLSTRLENAKVRFLELQGREKFLVAEIRRYWPAFSASQIGVWTTPPKGISPEGQRVVSSSLRGLAFLKDRLAAARGNFGRLQRQFEHFCRAQAMSGLGAEPSRIVVTTSEQIASCLAKGGQWIIAEPGRPESGVCVPQGTPWTGPGTFERGPANGGADGLLPVWCEQKGINWCIVGGIAAALIALSMIARR